MEKLLQSNKVFAAPIIAALILGLLFMTAVLPMVKMEPKNMPIGVLFEDSNEMATNMKNMLLSTDTGVVNFINFESKEALDESMTNREIYGALRVPADFSTKLSSLQTSNPEKAIIEIIINEGANATAATMVQQALTTMVANMNTQISATMLATVQEKTNEMVNQLSPMLQAQGENSPLAKIGTMISPIQPNQVANFANPIQAEIVKVNTTGNLGNAPIAFMTSTWFVSLIGAVILYLVGSNRNFNSSQQMIKFSIVQSILPFVYGIVAGYILTWYSTWILGFEVNHFNQLALIIALSIVAFTYLIFATLKWLKLPSILIYVLLMFFSMAAVQLPFEMLPNFYQTYLLPILPLNYFVGSLREVLFFSHNLINDHSIVLIWMLVVSFILVWVKVFIDKKKVA